MDCRFFAAHTLVFWTPVIGPREATVQRVLVRSGRRGNDGVVSSQRIQQQYSKLHQAKKYADIQKLNSESKDLQYKENTVFRYR